MLKEVPKGFQDLLADKTRAFAYLATAMKDGSPQVALAIADPDDPYRYVSVRGRVEEITEQVAAEHIDALAKKYTGVDQYPGARDDRVIYKIEPEKVSVRG